MDLDILKIVATIGIIGFFASGFGMAMHPDGEYKGKRSQDILVYINFLSIVLAILAFLLLKFIPMAV